MPRSNTIILIAFLSQLERVGVAGNIGRMAAMIFRDFLERCGGTY